ncbi:uncharacterized protein A4U43_C10F13140 [Asparagus officinalis]|uniref:Uncharacterized protein n=1 Tax=Asparagus officinalis TaxID=4686 RepID=A0A5P1E2E0_ASPOF|nr:uncharacterized protein A4U43_C10F13140 [Asparagus officinalis]
MDDKRIPPSMVARLQDLKYSDGRDRGMSLRVIFIVGLLQTEQFCPNDCMGQDHTIDLKNEKRRLLDILLAMFRRREIILGSITLKHSCIFTKTANVLKRMFLRSPEPSETLDFNRKGSLTFPEKSSELIITCAQGVLYFQ